MDPFSFLIGAGITAFLSFLYVVRLERDHGRQLNSVRNEARRKAYAQGYRDRSLLALRAQRPDNEQP
jgi:hypothetical protein